MQKLTGSKTLAPILAGAAGFLISVGAAVQGTGVVSLELQTDEAFRRLLQQPQDLSSWSRYVRAGE